MTETKLFYWTPTCPNGHELHLTINMSEPLPKSFVCPQCMRTVRWTKEDLRKMKSIEVKKL